MEIDDLHEGADVISRDGHTVGKLTRVVINEHSLKLTHLVVDPGLLHSGESLWKGGWGNPHTRVVPIGVLEDDDSEEVHITMSAEEFAHLSVKYDHVYWKPMPDLHPGRLDLSDLAPILRALPGGAGPNVPFDVMTMAPNEVDVAESSTVWRLKPHEKIGVVDHVLFDEDTNKMTALVVRRGSLFHHDVVLPAEYIVEIVEILEGVVRVEMTDDQLSELAAYVPVA